MVLLFFNTKIMATKNTEKKMNLFQKLLEIQKVVVGLGKDSKSFGYQYVSGSKVLEHIKPMMNDLGIILKQEVLDIENTRQDYTTKSGSKSEILTKAIMRFTWVDCETGEKDENMFAANGQNDWDKGVGSALTYAERYFLLKYFHIATDEDDIDNPNRKPTEVTKPNNSTSPTPKKPTISDLSKVKDALKKDRVATLKMLEKYDITEQQKKELGI
ncbi:ERF superfamily protein [Flavobacterium phage vB_FspP_elemoA_1-9C]|jgi:hypothetical protein|uniref:ERF superfamily protein n=3 Tax=Elemovirus TaxID=2948694 RepID=A0A7D7FB64_9CAUD|nr:Erf-like ssDNA annealing protein [Flavobacterium phage vB_FspP_elemoE_6-9C]YP_010109133.1 Erf-like ssDNA annealing protein [Flavobacterium phage vB_FspP_elemoD_13-5B]YP_010356102.1 Erf-like ssDNA annealing protein [Flavobacterium phage vB_FspP_elemoB_14-3B]QMP84735.1 ERF superfamily protein [Flavobacterium phage vB_FspP_elemoC_13-1C]QMP85009.1 ERF superfamily protein [Flavobacterium phage vB_FspP_elemoA_15-9B]QMP85457.1 ERF superfamily protein [Flavobacterium phage vB_FspP_elemoA_1-5B]QMP8